MRIWLQYLRIHHPAYRGLEINDENLSQLPEDAFVDDQMIVMDMEPETVVDHTEPGEDEEEEAPYTAAVPDLLAQNNEVAELRR